MQKMHQRNLQYAQSVYAASFEIYGGSFLKIFSGAGNLSNFVPFHENLRGNLIVENEIITA